MDLSLLRSEIDKIDDQLVSLFSRRMHIAARIADYKKEKALPIFAPLREQEKLLDVSRKTDPEMADYTRMLYSMLFELSRSYQHKRNTNTEAMRQKISDSIASAPDQNKGSKYICISENLKICPDYDKNRVMMALPHCGNALHLAMMRLHMLGLHIADMESCTDPDGVLSFVFYFDSETSIYSEEFVQLMCQLDDLCEEFKYLGSYSEVV